MIVLKQREYGLGARLSTAYHTVRNHSYANRADSSKKLSKEDAKLREKVLDRAKRLGEGVEVGATSSQFVSPIRTSDPFAGLFGSLNEEDIKRERVSRTGKIRVKKNSSAAVAAHELGHAYDYAAPSGIERTIDAYLANNKGKTIFGRAVKKGEEDYIEQIKRGHTNLEHEKRASKAGLKILSKEGATPKQMRSARKELKRALGSYYEYARARAAKTMQEESDIKALLLKNEHTKNLKRKYKEALKELEEVAKSDAEKQLDKKIRNTKIGVGSVIGAGLTYAGVKAYKHHKNKQKGEKK